MLPLKGHFNPLENGRIQPCIDAIQDLNRYLLKNELKVNNPLPEIINSKRYISKFNGGYDDEGSEENSQDGRNPSSYTDFVYGDWIRYSCD